MKNADKGLLGAVVAGGLIIAAVVGFIFLGGDSDGDSPSGRGAGGTAESGAAGLQAGRGVSPERNDPLEEGAGDRVSLPGTGRPDTPVDGPSGIARGVITGRVVDEQGIPLAAAEVRTTTSLLGNLSVTLRIGDEIHEPQAGGEESCLSDANGAFRLEGVEARESFYLNVCRKGYVPGNLPVKAFDGTVRDVGEVVLVLGGAIAGSVTDCNGVRVAGADVTAAPVDSEGGSAFFSLTSFLSVASAFKAVTGDDGTFRIDGIPAGKVNVSARHADHPSAVIEGVAVEKGEETGDVAIVLPRGFAIAGRVVDAGGEPVEHAAVTVEPTISFDFEDLENLSIDLDDTLKPALTDEAGCFVLKGLKEGKYTLEASAPACLSTRQEGIAAGTANLVFVLEKGGWLAGSVIDGRTGEGVERFTLDVNGEGDWTKKTTLLTGAEAVARMGDAVDEAGAFFIEGIGRDSWGFTVRAEGYGEERVGGLASVPGQGRFMDVELHPEAVVSGILLSAEDEPVEGGTVRLVAVGPGAPGNSSNRGVNFRTTSSLGDVTEYTSGGKKPLTASTEEDGSFRLRGAGRGSYRLEAEHEKHLDAEPHPLTLKRGEVVGGIELRLGAAGSIAGTVFGTDGAPLAGATINVSSGGGLASLIASGATGGSPGFDMQNVTAGPDGRYSVDGLAPGRYRLRLVANYDEADLSGMIDMSLTSAMGGRPPGTVEAIVRAGEVTGVDLHDRKKAVLAGKVTAAGGPVPGLRVGLFRSGLIAIMPIRTTSTGRDGRYRFDGLDEGAYDVRVNLPGQLDRLEEPAELEAGEHGTVDFSLPGGAIVGRVVDASTDHPLAGIEVAAIPAGGVKKKGLFDSLNIGMSASVGNAPAGGAGDELPFEFGGAKPVRTDGEGRFAIRFLAEGKYTVTAKGQGTLGTDREGVAVAEGRETSGIDFELSRGARLEGRVVHGLTGRSAGFCTVTCAPAGATEGEGRKSTLAGSDGSFLFEGLVPGSYVLSAEGEETAGTLAIDVTGTGKKDLEIRLQ